MKNILLLIASLVLTSCGGGSSNKNQNEVEIASSSSTVNVQGKWEGMLHSTIYDCSIDIEERPTLSAGVGIEQDNEKVTVFYGKTCESRTYAYGMTNQNGMQASGSEVTKCPNGKEALIIDTIELRGVNGNTANEMVYRLEVGCPDAKTYCYQEWIGQGTRVTEEVQTCSASTPAPTSDNSTIANSPISPPTSNAPSNSSNQDTCSRCDLRGCCSAHGGVVACSGNGGRVTCGDGSLSPSCKC